MILYGKYKEKIFLSIKEKYQNYSFLPVKSRCDDVKMWKCQVFRCSGVLVFWCLSLIQKLASLSSLRSVQRFKDSKIISVVERSRNHPIFKN